MRLAPDETLITKGPTPADLPFFVKMRSVSVTGLSRTIRSLMKGFCCLNFFSLSGFGGSAGPVMTGGVVRSAVNLLPMSVNVGSPVIWPSSLSCVAISVMYLTGASSPIA